jgi:hypothetical protein
MGVGWNGAGINAGSGTWTGARDYKELATLYCSDNGTWTYIPDSLPAAAATASRGQAGGTRRRGLFRKKSVSKKSAKTRRH